MWCAADAGDGDSDAEGGIFGVPAADHVMLTGPVGCGKTAAAYAVAQVRHRPCLARTPHFEQRQ